MYIECDSKKLNEAVKHVQKAVNDKSSLAVLEGILIKAYDDELFLNGYNIEFGINTKIETKIIDEGEIVLNARMFSEIVRKLPDDKVTIKTDENYSTEIKCGNSVFSITGLATDEYPELPQMDKEYSINISSNTLGSMIKQIIFAVSKNETNPVHKGILFEIENKKITAVAVDGFRLAFRQEDIDFDEKYGKISFIVPEKTLNEIINIFPEDDEKIKISVSKKHILLNIGEYEIFSRLIDGNFIDYKSAIPSEYSTYFCINTRELMESIERVSLVMDDKLKRPVHFKFNRDNIKISCSSAMGKAIDEVNVDLNGEELEMGFNNRYVLDALKYAQTDTVRVEIAGAVKPMKIMSCKDDNFLFLVLPVRVQ